MKFRLSVLLLGYVTALRRHLEGKEGPELKTARLLGRRSLALGLDTLEVARIHEEALILLALPADFRERDEAVVKRGALFFSEVIIPVEETHRSALEGQERLLMLTAALASVKKALGDETALRRSMEKSLRVSEATSSALLKKSLVMQNELRLLSHRLLSVQEEERKRISRELHDVIAQTLAGINLRLATLTSVTSINATDINKKIAVTQRLVERSVNIVHRFARDLRPTALDDLGLMPALDSHLKSFTERTGIPVGCVAFGGVEKLDNEARTAFYRVVQEALANVAQHSKATQAEVTISSRGQKVRLEIHDNGKGFNVDKVMLSRSGKHLGLLGMRERVEMIGGVFCVESMPGKETTIRVEIPRKGGGPRKRPVEKSADCTLKCE